MSAPQPQPRSRHAGQESVTPAQARPTGFDSHGVHQLCQQRQEAR
ncbi:MAG: hypothetical protein ACRDRU_10000 [Pseudonocardiaceae bacterium]